MKNIQVGKYRMRSDSLNVTLEKEHVQENGKFVMKLIGHYSTVYRACSKLLTLEINESEANTLREVIDVISRVKRDIKDMVEDIEFTE